MHHIVSDGWSAGLLVSEFMELYAAWREQRAARLPELPVQYGDFAVWQRGWLQGEVLGRQLEYWKGQLAGVARVQLPADHVRSAVASHRGAMHRFRIGRETIAGLKELGRREGVTLFMTLLAGFELLLARYSGQWDIAVGSPIANRNRVETEKLIGFFVNTLVLRLRMDPGWSFRRLLEEARRVTLEAYDHQDVPFEKLVEELAPERDLSRSPLFQVAFGLQNAARGEGTMEGVRLENWGTVKLAAAFELNLTLMESDNGGMDAFLEYATDLFEAASIERMSGHYRQLLAALSAGADQELRRVELISGPSAANCSKPGIAREPKRKALCSSSSKPRWNVLLKPCVWCVKTRS